MRVLSRHGPGYDLAAVRPLLSKVDALFLDVFDTALLRMVREPSDLFALLAPAARERGWSGSASDFARLRSEAERKARRAAGSREVSLDAIYEQLAFCSPLSLKACHELQAAEISLEQRFCRRNEEIFSLYSEARARGLGTAFLSDMYLPEPVVRGLLAAAGYDLEDAPLFLSNSEGATKADGSLFRLALRRMGLATDRVLHCGDNAHSDQRVPRQLGLRTIEYRRLQDRLEAQTFAHSPSIASSVTHAALARGSGAAGIHHRIGHDLLGPVLGSYVAWIASRVRRHPRTAAVYFASRDGFLLKALYDRLAQAQAGLPPSRYLYVSRRALFLPTMGELGSRELHYLCSSTGAITVWEILERIGLDPRSLSNPLEEHGFASPSEVVDYDAPGDRGRLESFFHDARIREALAAKQREESSLLERYLRQEGLVPAERIAFVDIGWSASMQVAIARCLDGLDANAPVIDGYFLGTYPRARAAAVPGRSLVNGYLCAFGAPSRAMRSFQAFESLFETAAMATHGTVLGYRDQAGHIEPALDEMRYSTATTQAIAELQRGVTDFFETILPLGDWDLDAFDDPGHREALVAQVERITTQPTPLEAGALGDLEHNDGFGRELNLARIAAPLDSSWPLDPSRFVEAYRRSYWKPGFLMRQPPVLRNLLLAGWDYSTHLKRIARELAERGAE